MVHKKQNLKLGKRIRGGFNRITIVIIVMMLISIISNIMLVSYTQGLFDGPYQRMVIVGNIELSLENIQKNLYTGIAEDNPTLITRSLGQLEGNYTDLNDNIERLKMLSSESETEEITSFQNKMQNTYELSKNIQKHLTTYNSEGINEYIRALDIMRVEAIPYFDSAKATLGLLKGQSEQAASDYLSDAVRAQIAVLSLMIVSLLVGIFVSSRTSKRLEKEILTPVEELVEVSTLLSKGEIDVNITYDKEDELGVLADSMKGIVAALKDLIDEANSMSQAAVAGKLENRGDAEKFQGAYRDVIQGVNNTLDSLVNPLKMSADYMEQISKGNIPEKITAEAHGDFIEINNSINTCIDAVNRLIADTGELVKASVHGRLNQRADSSSHGGDFAKIIDGVNKTIDTLVGHIDALPSPVMIIDRDYSILYANEAAANVSGITQEQAVGRKCYDCMQSEDCKTEGCACGKAMEENVKASRETIAHPNDTTMEITYTGIPLRDDNGEIVGALELIVDQTDIKAAARQAERNVEIAKKQAEFQDNEVNQLIVNLEKLAKGDLSIVTSSRETDDDTRRIGENFTRIDNYLNNCVNAIQSLIDDATEMTVAAVEGILEHRSDTSKHGGSYAMIMEGLNHTLDAIVEPIGNALHVLQEMERGNLHLLMEGDYQGDYATIKTTMNSTITNIQSYIDDITHVISEIADGNLNIQITADYLGDFVQIKDSLNHIIFSFNQVMRNISEAADQVNSGSRQVAYGSQTLSQGSTEQASSIQELTASIAEVAVQTKNNAVNANQASELAYNVKDNAIQGNSRMNGMLSSMDDINASSANISKIIKVIDDIAFQTNILALNAAVEAARAGQHGKGFAVVAEEVRNLAVRSADAAKHTTELIESSIQKVDAGTKLANETASALNEIVLGIEKATNIVSEIADASNEQATAIAQINRGIEQVSGVVQNNSATAEESAAASEELSSQAELLKEMVEQFRLSELVMAPTGAEHKLSNNNPDARQKLFNNNSDVKQERFNGNKHDAGQKLSNDNKNAEQKHNQDVKWELAGDDSLDMEYELPGSSSLDMELGLSDSSSLDVDPELPDSNSPDMEPGRSDGISLDLEPELSDGNLSDTSQEALIIEEKQINLSNDEHDK